MHPTKWRMFFDFKARKIGEELDTDNEQDKESLETCAVQVDFSKKKVIMNEGPDQYEDDITVAEFTRTKGDS